MRRNERLNPTFSGPTHTAILIGTSTLSSIFHHTRAHIGLHPRLAEHIHSKNLATLELLATLVSLPSLKIDRCMTVRQLPFRVDSSMHPPRSSIPARTQVSQIHRIV